MLSSFSSPSHLVLDFLALHFAEVFHAGVPSPEAKCHHHRLYSDWVCTEHNTILL